MGRLKEIIKEELFYREFYRNESASIINEQEEPGDANVKQILDLLGNISPSVSKGELEHIQITLTHLMADESRPEK